MEKINTKAFVQKNTMALLVACMLIFTIPALSQSGGPYDLSWNTIDGGGGVSSGGQYVLRGVIGQPDAGTMKGGRYTLNGGFLTSAYCLSHSAPEYTDWFDLGRPDCWCYQRQCRGDADGLPNGKDWVSNSDLAILKSAWQIPNGPVDAPGICADFDHLSNGKNSYRVSSPDLAILKSYYAKPEPNVPCCDNDQDCILEADDKYNFWKN